MLFKLEIQPRTKNITSTHQFWGIFSFDSNIEMDLSMLVINVWKQSNGYWISYGWWISKNLSYRWVIQCFSICITWYSYRNMEFSKCCSCLTMITCVKCWLWWTKHVSDVQHYSFKHHSLWMYTLKDRRHDMNSQSPVKTKNWDQRGWKFGVLAVDSWTPEFCPTFCYRWLQYDVN